MAVRKRKKVGGTVAIAGAARGARRNGRINACHTFTWSRLLWKAAAREMAQVCVVFVAVYLAAAVLLARHDGLRGVDVFYFISATMTTTGLGDLSPQGQLNRACAVVLLPYGLVVVSFAIAMSMAYVKSHEPLPTGADSPGKLSDADGDGQIELWERFQWLAGVSRPALAVPTHAPIHPRLTHANGDFDFDLCSIKYRSLLAVVGVYYVKPSVADAIEVPVCDWRGRRVVPVARRRAFAAGGQRCGHDVGRRRLLRHCAQHHGERPLVFVKRNRTVSVKLLPVSPKGYK